MIKKVRIKFTIVSMAAMTFCTVLLLFTINLINYQQVNEQLNTVLTEIADGQMKKQNENAGFEIDESTDELIKQKTAGRHSADVQYGARYFSVFFTENDRWQPLLKNYDILTEDEAIALAQTASDSGKTSGYQNDYKFVVINTDTMYTICFLDCSTELHSIHSLFRISIIIGILGLILVFIFVFLMSKKAIQPLVESMDKQKRFITDAGHELKTPVSVIGTNMDILSMDVGKENEWIDSTQRQVVKLRKLIAHLISLSKLEEEQTELVLTPLSLSDAAAECTEVYEVMAESEGKTLTCHLEDGLRIRGDETTIRQLLTILCENAVKYASDSSEIIISLRVHGHKVIFKTANLWSRNVAPADFDKLFERFYRGDTSRNRDIKANGYGLGLSIAQNIVKKNRGELKVSEDAENRLVFCATFPLYHD